MDKKRISLIIAVLEVLSALPLYAIYTMAIRFYDADNYWSLVVMGTNLFGLLFLVLPIMGLFGLLRGWRSAYLWMGLYPLVAFMFGVMSIPFATYFYSDNTTLNTIFIALINTVVLSLVVWLFVTMKTRSSNALQPTPRNGDAEL